MNVFLQTVRKRSPRYLDVSSGTFKRMWWSVKIILNIGCRNYKSVGEKFWYLVIFRHKIICHTGAGMKHT